MEIELKLKYRIGGRSKKTSHHGDNSGKASAKKSFRGVTPPSKVMCMDGGNGHCVMMTREDVAVTFGHVL